MKIFNYEKLKKTHVVEEGETVARRQRIFIILVVIMLMAAATVILVNTVNNSIYSERSKYLSELTEASSETVNQSIRDQRKQCLVTKNIIENQLPRTGDVDDFVVQFSKELELGKDMYFLVDSDGTYYCSDGNRGRIADRAYYTDTSEDELQYLATLPHLDSEKTYLIFRFRLDEPIKVKSQGKTVEITYFSVMHDLDELNDTVSALFEGANNTFIYETDTGTMLYKQFGMGMIMKGYVVYPKLYDADLIKGETPEECVEKCKNHETLVVEMKIKGESYYFCSTPLDINNWSLAFVMSKEYIVLSSGSSFGSIVIAIVVFAILLSLAIILVSEMIMNARVSGREREALKKVSAAKSSFLFNMSHDIRTPMNAIIGFTNIALKNLDDKERVRDSLQKTQLSGNILLSLINDILEFSRIESGNVTLSETGADITEAFGNTSAVLAEMAKEKNIDLSYEVGEIRDRRVLLDETRYQRLLINVISNGIKYTPEGGYVKVFMEQLEDEKEGEGLYRFTVSDNGIGMSEEFQEHIFEEFTREETSTASGVQGTGLGLALCKSITELFGGTIVCESTQGVGSTFTITLPLRLQTGEEGFAEGDSVPSAELDLAGSRILIVEDNELNREIAIDILEEMGAETDEAENGREALERLAEVGIESYDFILMDIQMPVMGGYEAAVEIKNRFPESSVPVIALSANAFEEDKQKSRDAGMTDHIAKPINIDELCRVLGKHKRNGGAE